MLEKIETKEIMTCWEAMQKYRTQHFIMAITEEVDQCYNDLGYVMYVADKEREFHQIPRSEYKDKQIAFMFGVAAEPYPIIGNVVYHD
ncbi:MAG: hypothetical protein FWB96_05330 [Defluviitaleaceae bacterium]|nr:hypothetical protein [Defluviitaleaceae bacterium]MCL2263007.1 hypothetical protein [Defluviitaleaceae bacterium]